MRIRPPRDAIRDSLDHLLRVIGDRPATSVAEAQAAAYVDAQLRRAGLSVAVRAFRAPRRPAMVYALLSWLGLTAALLAGSLPIMAITLALIALALTIGDALRSFLPPLAPMRESQYVAAVRPCRQDEDLPPQPPRWHIVLLAALDTPTDCGLLRPLCGTRRTAVLGRSIALALVLVLALVGLFDRRPFWWYAQLAPALYLVLTVLPPTAQRRPEDAAARSGALAAALTAGERLNELRSVEVWIVGLGATANSSGLRELLHHYPFPRDRTLFVGVEQIANGHLVYATREGVLQAHAADPLLLKVAAAADAADPLINAEPRPYHDAPTLVTPLHRQGYRTLTLLTLPATISDRSNAQHPQQQSLIDRQTVDQATRLLVGLTEQLDRTT